MYVLLLALSSDVVGRRKRRGAFDSACVACVACATPTIGAAARARDDDDDDEAEDEDDEAEDEDDEDDDDDDEDDEDDDDEDEDDEDEDEDEDENKDEDEDAARGQFSKTTSASQLRMPPLNSPVSASSRACEAAAPAVMCQRWWISVFRSRVEE